MTAEKAGEKAAAPALPAPADHAALLAEAAVRASEIDIFHAIQSHDVVVETAAGPVNLTERLRGASRLLSALAAALREARKDSERLRQVTAEVVPAEYRSLPVRPTCEVWPGPCGAPTTHWYPTMGGGTMALCHEHAQKHLPHCYPYALAGGRREAAEPPSTAGGRAHE